jgi:3'-phosphoadenosine 5'-phosphosulfate sulfotransferase (PAPS reductase)/FAD synthetase
MRVLSLGWGVQSTTIAVMAALGDIEPLTAVHADTRHERSGTYEYAAMLTPWLTERGVEVVTVRATASPLTDQRGGVSVPAYSDRGMVRRQCTGDWKIAPIRRWIQAHRQRQPVDLLMGISLDEIQRMRDSGVRYLRNVYPLVDLRMTRAACVRYLTAHGIAIPPRSACVFCPMQSARDWRAVKAHADDWQHATAADEQIRHGRMGGKHGAEMFVHRSLRPLRDVDLRTEQEKGQMDMFDSDCSGACFV